MSLDEIELRRCDTLDDVLRNAVVGRQLLRAVDEAAVPQREPTQRFDVPRPVPRRYRCPRVERDELFYDAGELRGSDRTGAAQIHEARVGQTVHLDDRIAELPDAVT